MCLDSLRAASHKLNGALSFAEAVATYLEIEASAPSFSHKPSVFWPIIRGSRSGGSTLR
jgi:hypothetical protein